MGIVTRSDAGRRRGQRPIGVGSACVFALAALAGCSTFEEQLRQFDSVARLDERPEPGFGNFDYTRYPARHGWLLRNLEGSGLGEGWIWLFGIEPGRLAIDNRSGYARERLQRLPRLAGDDLQRMALVATRLHLVAESDRSVLNRVVALHGAATLLDELGVDPARTVQMRFTGRVDLWQLEPGWPGREELQGNARRSDRLREQHLQALVRVTEFLADDPSLQRQTISLLAKAERFERDPEVRRVTQAALVRALDLGLSYLLLKGLKFGGSSQEREVSFHELRRLGGPDAMPILLAIVCDRTDASNRPVASSYLLGQPLGLRRAVVSACGRLRGPVIEQRFALRATGPGPCVVQVLYDTIQNDPDDGLRAVALDCLAQALQRPRDPDPAWAREWYREWVLRDTGEGN